MKKIIALLSLFAITTAHAGDAEEVAAMMLNLNGLLCAEVVDLSALKQQDVYEIRCVKYRGGKSQATYILDMTTGKAWEE